MSMLTFYVNRAGKTLPASRKRTLQRAKEELRKQFGRACSVGRAAARDASRHVLARIVGLLAAPLAHELIELGIAPVGKDDAHASVEIAATALGGQALSLETE